MTLENVCSRLKEAGIEASRLEAEIMIREICRCEPSESGAYGGEELELALQKRCDGYPLQYIIGKWWLCRCEFEVNEHCLCPRTDTETVIETAKALLPKGAHFADLCTGSGCIAISLLELRADTRALAVELYPETLETAKRNAIRNGVADRAEFVLGDVLTEKVLGNRHYDVIISNPPYIKSDVIDTLSREVKHEPRAALDGGEDGLVFYRAIVDNFANNLNDGGAFVFEIGYDQAESLRNIAEKRGFCCEIKKDLGGCDRVAVLRRKIDERQIENGDDML